jgi:hypothetical protein
VVGLPHPLRRIVEHVYLTDLGGTPLVHLSHPSATEDKDPDMVASMFTAIQNFMDDSFHSMGIGDVRSLEVGEDHHVSFGRGHALLLYVVYRGHESNRLERHVIRLVHDLEDRFATLVRSWDGDVEALDPLRQYLEHEWQLHARALPNTTLERSPGA